MQRVLQLLMLIIGASVLGLAAAYADGKDSTRVVLTSKEIPDEVKAQVYRKFEGLGIASNEHIEIDPILLPTTPLADSTLQQRSYAQSLLEKVKEGHRFVETLTDLSVIDLPVGIVKPGGSFDYSILINTMTITTKGAMLDVYVSLALPQTHDQLAFHGMIPLSAKGGIAGSAKVFLIGDHNIKFNGNTLLTIKGEKNTYVEFDCNGFVGVSLEAEVQFSREIIIPEDSKGDATTGTERVKVNFTTYAHSLNDIKVGISIPPFQVSGMDGFGFTVTDAVLDWSDLSNPTDIVFPKDYTSAFLQAGEPNLWQGFFLKYLEVRLPAAFCKKKEDQATGTRIKIDVTNMIIDDQGFTGSVVAAPVLQLGDMSGWSYSIDKLGLVFVTNQVKGFEVAGQLTIPVIKGKDGKTTQFGYLAQRGADGNYIFAVKTESELKFPLFVADLNLFQGSSIIVKEHDGHFYPTAILNGEISLHAGKTAFNSLQFQGLKISSETPHFDIQSIGFGKEGGQTQSMSKYPLVINNIMIKREPNHIGIGFDVTINIAGNAEEGGFGGTAALIVWGKQETVASTSSNGANTSAEGDWKFDKVEVSGIGINFKKAGVIEIAGMIRFFEDDPIYGDGFKGSISGKIQVITLQVETLFGKTSNYRYWFADAKVDFENGLPLVSGISAYGFGGGFYSKMKQSTGGASGSTIGQTASGIIYVPDENSMGIKAMVKFGCTGSQMPYNGDVTLEVAMNKHGGINSVTFTGNVRMLTPPPIVQAAIVAKEMIAAAVNGGDNGMDKFMDPAQGQVSGHIKIFFDNENHIFHANTEIYMNVAGGIVKGIGAGNKAGWAVMHFERNDWYVLIGTPDDPVGIEILWMLKMRSYFMLGKHLPGSPPPPKQVSEILGVSGSDLDYMRDMNSLESGLGFAFGMNFSMDTGDLRFLMFYGRFSAGIGTDIMLKQYGTQYHCEGSNNPIGINGWYANGQAYAYVQGKIGIRVRLRFYKGDFDILSIGAAAVMQAKGPNPFWMKGMVGGYYRILGGLVKGNCKFEVVIGKDCKIANDKDLLADVKLISSVGPLDGATDVEVFNGPQVAFSVPISQVFKVTDIQDKIHSYRANLKEFSLYDGSSLVEGKQKWNDDHDVVVLDAADILYPHKAYKVKVVVSFEEYIGGKWSTAVFDGTPSEEKVEVKFTTGDAPDNIIPSNIEYTYPIAGQYNFYTNEYPQGFIKLKKGQPYLFTDDTKWIKKARFTEAGGNAIDNDFLYDNSDKKVSFSIPTQLSAEKIYNFQLVNIPKSSMDAPDKNVKRTETSLANDTEGGEIKLSSKSIEGQVDILETNTMYNSFFRTSKYKTFSEKIAGLNVSSPFTTNVAINILQLNAYLRSTEYFDKIEMEGSLQNEIKPLVELEADLTDNFWYQNDVFPLVYDSLPLRGYISVSRTPSILGLPPVRDLSIGEDWNGYFVESDGKASTTGFSGDFKLHYNIMPSMYTDYLDIQNKVAITVIEKPGTASPHELDLLLKAFPVLKPGDYKINIRYRIPGVKNPTTIRMIKMTPDLSR